MPTGTHVIQLGPVFHISLLMICSNCEFIYESYDSLDQNPPNVNLTVSEDALRNTQSFAILTYCSNLYSKIYHPWGEMNHCGLNVLCERPLHMLKS